MLRAILGVALAGVIGLLTALPAASHDQLVDSTPADGAVLTTLPERVELAFSSNVVPIAPVLVVQGAAGTVVQEAAPTASGRVLHTPMPTDLGPGGYVVRWRVVAQDGHPVEGSFTFRFEPAPSSSSTTPGTGTPGASPPAASPDSSAAPSATPDAAGAAALPPGAPRGIALGAAALAAVSIALAAVLARRRLGVPAEPAPREPDQVASPEGDDGTTP